jgi:negative regulator of sigma E activity
MPGKMPRVNPLQLRKELLVAESELNRAQLIEEWQAMTVGVRTFGARVKTVGSVASVAALFVAGVSAFRRGRASSNGANASWLQTALKGAKIATSIWLAFRARGSERKDNYETE